MTQETIDLTAQVTLGVLGHVDHGKTSLVKALTGIDTDRLKEEKKRGLSIVLGFAYLETAQGIIDFIDVPGHEDFIHTMISGATGIDCVMIIVDANEGIKPQTEEHFNIIKFLGIQKGLVVITKTDQVSQDKCDEIRQEINKFLQGTFLEGVLITETSTITGHGLQELRDMLEGLLKEPVTRPNIGKIYLPFDRVFTMAGHGTVATGTLRNGILTAEESVEIMPKGLKVSIRQMQVHNKSVKHVNPGQRVAVNFRQVDKDEISRGDALISSDSLIPTRLLDAELLLLDHINHPPMHGDFIRLLFGTSEILANLRILGGSKSLSQGASVMVQFVCNHDIVVPVGEPFIVRTMSPLETIGGGCFLDNHPVKHRHSDPRIVARLTRLASEKESDVIEEKINAAGNSAIDYQELTKYMDITSGELEQLLDDLHVIRLGKHRIISKVTFNTLCGKVVSEVERYHSENPSRSGQPLRDLRSRLASDIDDVVFKFLIDFLSTEENITRDKDVVRLNTFNPLQTLNLKEQQLSKEIEYVFKTNDFTPPDLDEVLHGDPERKRLFYLLTDSGVLITMRNRDIKRTIVFHCQTIDELTFKLESTYPSPNTFTVSDVRKLLNTSRKFAIPLLEYLDSHRITIRIGEKRKLVKKQL